MSPDACGDMINIESVTAMGLKAIAYNLMIVSNVKAGEKSREIMKILSC